MAKSELPLNASGSNPTAASPRAKWDHLVSQLRTVEGNEADEMSDESVDLAGNLASALMAMPCPDAHALRWKLDYLLDASPRDYTASYSSDFVAQTVADYRRLLASPARSRSFNIAGVDRLNLIADNLDVLLRNVWNDLETAGVLNSEDRATKDALISLSMAQEFVAELDGLGSQICGS